MTFDEINVDAVEAAYAEAMAMTEGEAKPEGVELLARLFILHNLGRTDLEDRVWEALAARGAKPAEETVIDGKEFRITTHPFGDGYLAHAEALDHVFSRDLHRPWPTRQAAYDAMVASLEKELG